MTTSKQEQGRKVTCWNSGSCWRHCHSRGCSSGCPGGIRLDPSLNVCQARIEGGAYLAVGASAGGVVAASVVHCDNGCLWLIGI